MKKAVVKIYDLKNEKGDFRKSRETSNYLF